MIIRVQSSEGSKRLVCDQYDSTELLYQKILTAFGLEDIFGFSLYKDKSLSQPILMHQRKSLSDFKLKHGDLLYLGMNKMDIGSEQGATTKTMNNHSSNFNHVQMDEVDLILMKRDGQMERGQDPRLCHHGPNGKCVHCTPLEPFDQNYMKEHNIKHMSFHAYQRMLKQGIDKGKFVSLEDISCKIKPGCKGHAPWPEGICTKCQPSAITLNPQVYRHVDNVTFENTQIVENYLNYWRVTGQQRMGLLYGYYEPHKDVPLGIRAVVVAIYEPPQRNFRDLLEMNIDDLNLHDVDNIAHPLGYKQIGWIFTDLLADDMQKGTVKHTRNASSFFLSCQEVITAAYLQNKHPNPCNLAKSGYFGSKYVTVCVTGDKENQVHMEAYQVSNQCMALVRDGCLVPTTSPEIAWVLESNRELYVPDVFYKKRDEYGNSVTKIARPLPIEYLLVDVPVSAPIEQVYTFNSLTHLKSFPIENRYIEGHLQDFNVLCHYMKQFSKDEFLEAVSDFHLLVYLASMETLPLRDALPPLLQAIKARDRSQAEEWAAKDKWATVEQLMLAGSSDLSSSTNSLPFSSANSSTPKWSCQYCTFENEGRNSNCEMCNLPK